MQRSITIAAICMIVSVLLSTPALAQCPALTNPLQLIDGQTWAFEAMSGGNSIGQASIGKFTAKYVAPSSLLPFGRGMLTVTQSLDLPAYVVDQLTSAGTYQIYPDCSGGTLSFNNGLQAITFAFVFTSNFTEMYLISTLNSGPEQSNWGAAKLVPAFSCPVGTTNPLDVIKGMTFGFKLEPATYYQDFATAVAGIFTASEGLSRGANPTTIGTLGGSFTKIPYLGSPTSLAAISGRYIMETDCSGGSIMFGTAVLPQTLKFIFTNAAFTEMYLLSMDGTNPYAGHSKKF